MRTWTSVASRAEGGRRHGALALGPTRRLGLGLGISLCLLALLAACGQKGPLTLPSAPPTGALPSGTSAPGSSSPTRPAPSPAASAAPAASRAASAPSSR